ncbi:hypothetical protein [Dactylosporangium sp. NPDC051541]|uniref:hypothetical protein n=1 Tax=Dactylosporangium sp. NPDC051541 TaxID=3363977 RepID=UPI003796A80D
MNDNPFANLMREDVPDSRVQVGAVIAGGRARVRRRQAATVVAAAAAVVVVVGGAALAAVRPEPVRPDPVQPPPSSSPSPSVRSCQAVPLPELGAPAWVAVDAAGHYFAGTPTTAIGTVNVLGPEGLSTVRSSAQKLIVTGVNGNGTIIGNATNDTDTESGAFVIENRMTVRLSPPPGALDVRAAAINDTGDVVGDARMPGNTFQAVVWRYGKWNEPQPLAIPAGIAIGPLAAGGSSAYGIAADGRIVGSIGNGAAPFLWNADGGGHVLDVPAGKPGGIAVRIAGEWAQGTVDVLADTHVRPDGRRVGNAEPESVRWNLRTGQVQPIEAGHPSIGAAGLLPDGTVVVHVQNYAVLWTDRGVTRLPMPKGSTHIQITGAANDGTVVGFVTEGEPAGAYRWNCR